MLPQYCRERCSWDVCPQTEVTASTSTNGDFCITHLTGVSHTQKKLQPAPLPSRQRQPLAASKENLIFLFGEVSVSQGPVEALY